MTDSRGCEHEGTKVVTASNRLNGVADPEGATPSAIPMIINGVNPQGEPLIIMECGATDFRIVYFDSNCIANILSFGNIVSVSESVSYDNYQDCYKVKMIKSVPVYCRNSV